MPLAAALRAAARLSTYTELKKGPILEQCFWKMSYLTPQSDLTSSIRTQTKPSSFEISSRMLENILPTSFPLCHRMVVEDDARLD